MRRESNTMCHRAGSLVLLVSLAVANCTAQPTPSEDNPSTQPSNNRSRIGGTVSSQNDVPLHDIRIEVRAADTAELVATCYSSQSGGFEVPDLPSGQYDIVATDGSAGTRQRVDLQNGLTTVNLRLGRAVAMSPKIGTVSVIELKTPEKARNLTAKAQNALRKNHKDEARKNVEKALAISPDYPYALTLRAAIELSDDKTQSAEEDLDHAVKVDPNYGPAYLVLGALFNSLGRYDEALRSLDRGSMYDPKSWQCAFEASRAWMGKHDYEHAVEQLDRAERLSARRVLPPIHLLRGYALIAQKRFEQARVDLENYLKAEPNSEHAGSVRASLAKIRTYMAQKPDSLTLPAMTGMFAMAQPSH
jgi:Tfp pilus assembly protein PilF